MKIVFLDIDGVLNHWDYLKEMIRPDKISEDRQLLPLIEQAVEELESIDND